MKAKLILVAGKADKGEVRLKLPTIIGRTREAGLMIAHKTVSRRHCELFERHGMLYVRDSGSLNGTLVDDAPIKESMLKPGHTVTVGPLTFRAEYEPADAFLGGDDDGDAVNGSAEAAVGLTSVGESNRTAAIPTFNGEFEAGSETAGSVADADEELDFGAPEASASDAAEDVLDFGGSEPADESGLDFGGDETVSMEIADETTDLGSIESPEGMAALESSEFDASEFTSTDPGVAALGSTESDGPATVEDDLDMAFSLDEIDGPVTEAVHVESSDDLDLEFGEATDAAPEAVAAAPAAEPAAESSDFDLDLGDDFALEPAADSAADVENLLPAGAEAGDSSFDFSDDTPAASGSVESPAAEGDEEFSLAGDDDLDFGGPAEVSAGAAAAAEFDLEDDGGTFDLADDSPAPAAAAEPAADSEALDFGVEEEVSFDLEGTADESDPGKNDAKGPAKKKPADEDDEMSDFLKELGM